MEFEKLVMCIPSTHLNYTVICSIHYLEIQNSISFST